MRTTAPSDRCPVADIEPLLRHPGAQAKGDGKFFREAIRLFHWPFHDTQQEGIDSGPLHSELKVVTARVFTRFAKRAYGAEMASRYVSEWADGLADVTVGNLLDQLRPIIVQIMFELLFERPASPPELDVYTAAATNFHVALKGTGIVSRWSRRRMFRDLKHRIEGGDFRHLYRGELTDDANVDRLARHFGTMIFYTAVTQTLEFTAHTLAAVAQHRDVATALDGALEALPAGGRGPAADLPILDYAMMESLRLFPLFPRTYRVATDAIDLGHTSISRGDVVVLDFLRAHQQDWPRPKEFLPERWNPESESYASAELRERHYMPFGVGPRACPAQEFAPRLTKALIVAIVSTVRLTVPDEFEHTRRIAVGVPAVIERRDRPVSEAERHSALERSRAAGPLTDAHILFPLPGPFGVAGLAWSAWREYGSLGGSLWPALVATAQIRRNQLSQRLRRRIRGVQPGDHGAEAGRRTSGDAERRCRDS